MTKAHKIDGIILTAALVSISLTVLVYGSAVSLPLYSDDLLQVPWVKSTPLIHFWYQEGPYGDYRPLHFSIWRLLYLGTGGLSPALLHGLNLLGHAFCGMLVGCLAARWKGKSWGSIALTTALFILFPFAFDAVLWVSAFSYPLTTALTLGSVLVYLKAWDEKNRWLHMSALFLTALAAFSYEGGIVAGFIILWCDLLLHGWPLSRWAWAHGSISALIALWISLLSSSVPSHYLTGIHPFHNLLIALQCLVFPVAPLAMVGDAIAVKPLVLLIPIGVLCLLGLGYLVAKRRTWSWFLLGAGWAIMWSVIPILSQPFNWFRDPPRVFYPSAAGIALFWGVALDSLLTDSCSLKWRRLAQVFLYLAIFLPVFFFLRSATTLCWRTGDLLWEAIRVAQVRPGSLVVNLPGRITPEERFYPLGHEGVIPLPPPTNGELLVSVHTGEKGLLSARSQGGILPPLPLDIEPADPPVSSQDLRNAREVALVTYQEEQLGIETVGEVSIGHSPASALARFGNALFLLSASCHWTGPSQITVDATWQLLNPIEGQPTVFAHWLNVEGILVAQADGAPLSGLYPFSQWEVGDRVHERRVIEQVPSHEGVVALGVWDPEEGMRFDAVNAAGDLLLDNAFRLELCTP